MNYQNLPYSANQPQTQPLQYTPDRPPFVPQGIAIPQQLSYLLPTVSAMVANEVVAQMGKHAGRMFTFNQFAANNYANPDFATAVASVFDYLMLNLIKGIITVPEAGLSEAVSRIVTLISCHNFAKFPPLAQMVDARVLQDANQALIQGTALQNEIMQMKMRGQQQQQPYQNQQPAWQQSNVPVGFAGTPAGYAPPYNRFNDQQNTAWSPPQNTPSPFTRGTQNFTNVSTPVAPVENDRYTYLAKAAPPPVASPQPVQPFQFNAPAPMLVKAETVQVEKPVQKELVWSSSHHQYHQPAFNSETEKLELHELVDGNKTYVIAKVVTKGENEVDRNQHVITTPMMTLTSHIPAGAATRQEAFEKSVEKMVQSESPAFNGKTVIDNNWLLRNFADEMIFDARVSQKLAKPENDCGVYQIFAIKGTPFVATKDIEETALQLSKMKNFQEVALTMQSILNSDIDQEVKDFVFELDMLLTKEINSMLRNKMSMVNFIDSFIDDICDMSEFLRTTKGETYAKAFDDCQKTFIETFLAPITEDEIKSELASVFSQDEDSAVKLSSVFYEHNYTITNVRLHSSELKIGIGKGTSSIITEQSFPVLRNFCKKLFQSADKTGKQFAHHIMITSDFKKYELHRSMFVPDTYLISYFN